MGVGTPIWNTSHVGNFFQIAKDVELIKKSYAQQV
jgi:adenine C2-methylase RlmN of 23S rRNA A2503 and tRNA A37